MAQKNSCGSTVGLDCSGLTGWTLANAGFRIPTNSTSQRDGGTDIPRQDGLPGDIIGYPGHVAVYLGRIGGVDYLLEAPDVGLQIRVQTGELVRCRPVCIGTGRERCALRGVERGRPATVSPAAGSLVSQNTRLWLRTRTPCPTAPWR